MLKTELLIIQEKTVNEPREITHRITRILNIYTGLLEQIFRIHVVCSLDVRRIINMKIPDNLVFHQLGVWRERKRYTRLLFHTLYFLHLAIYCSKLLRKNKKISAILNLTNHQTLGLIVVFLSKLFRRKSIIRVSNDLDAAVFTFQEKYGSMLGKIYRRITYKVEQYVFKSADVIISVSPIILDEYPQYYSKTFVIPVTSSAVERYCNKRLTEKKFEKWICILYVGRLEPEKGVEILLNALVGLRNIKCLIVGDGSLKSKLIEKTQKLGIQDSVEFYGILSQEKVFKLMEKSDILVLPSYSEYTPNVLVEATTIGLPIIASNVGGIKYLVKDGETGILFSKGNVEELRRKILFLKENPVVREKIRVKAKEFVCKNYNASVTKMRAERLLKMLFNS